VPSSTRFFLFLRRSRSFFCSPFLRNCFPPLPVSSNSPICLRSVFQCFARLRFGRSPFSGDFIHSCGWHIGAPICSPFALLFSGFPVPKLPFGVFCSYAPSFWRVASVSLLMLFTFRECRHTPQIFLIPRLFDAAFFFPPLASAVRRTTPLPLLWHIRLPTLPGAKLPYFPNAATPLFPESTFVGIPSDFPDPADLAQLRRYITAPIPGAFCPRFFRPLPSVLCRAVSVSQSRPHLSFPSFLPFRCLFDLIFFLLSLV